MSTPGSRQPPGGSGVPPAAVGADLSGLRDGSTGQRIGEAGLPTPEGHPPPHRSIRPQQPAHGAQPRSGERADRQDVDTERVLGHPLDSGRHVGTEVGLGEDDDRCRAAAPRPPGSARPAALRTKALVRGRTDTARSARTAIRSPTAGPPVPEDTYSAAAGCTRCSPVTVSTVSRPRSTRDTRAGTHPVGSSVSRCCVQPSSETSLTSRMVPGWSSSCPSN